MPGDPAVELTARFDARLADELRELLSPALVAEYEADPDGQHSPALSRVLSFLGRRPAPSRVLVHHDGDWATWRLVRVSGAVGTPFRIADRRTFASEREALGAAFRRDLFTVFGWGEDPGEDAVDGPPLDDRGATALLAYADRVSVRPGEEIAFMVSAEGVSQYDAELVRLLHGDDDPRGPGVRVESVSSALDGRHPGRFQPIHPGAHVVVGGETAPLDGTRGFAFATCAFPTVRTGGRQTVASRWDDAAQAGWAVGLDGEGRLALWLGDGGTVHAWTLPQPLELHAWHGVAVSYDARSGDVQLVTRALPGSANGRLSPVVVDASPRTLHAFAPCPPAPAPAAPLLFGALAPRAGAERAGMFNGKLEGPSLWPHALPAAQLAACASASPDAPRAAYRWSFAPVGGDASALTVPCEGHPQLSGRLVNLPVRGVTGRRWDGRATHFAHAPEQYDALHFHEDALEDCGWQASHRLVVPDDLASGVYALRLRAVAGENGGAVDRDATGAALRPDRSAAEEVVPFVVRPARGATAPLALLLPTATYQAYANDRGPGRGFNTPGGIGRSPVLQPGNLALELRRELGHSSYGLHRDGSGVCCSSWRRPILTNRPSLRTHLSPWTLMSDLFLVDWLERSGFAFDVISDHDLHAEGEALLRPYRAVLTGTHPEYASEQMLDALEGYVDRGGKLLYSGGNGFYWAVAFHPELPHVMEIRRGESGSRSWEGRPGEHVLAATGEPAGLWRSRGRAPQKLFGVGFSAQGGGASGHYETLPGAACAWVFDGVFGETFGAFGVQGDGAAGAEIDRYDQVLGSPPGALLLATSAGMQDRYQLVVEETTGTAPWRGAADDPGARSDIVLFETRGGGAVFSTGSIAWAGSLSHDGGDNDVARITRNVLTRWLAD